MHAAADKIADEILVLDAQDGRREALEALVGRWQKRLWWHAYHLTGETETAWDVTQESWLNIVRGLARLQDPGKFGAWAYRIVSHKAHDWRRRNPRESGPDPERPDPPVATLEPAQQQTVSDVHDILRRLPARSQVVLNLYYLEGFDLAEVAGILGAPEGTVKSRLHTARLEFRKHWESLGAPLPAALPAPGKESHHE